MAQHLLSVYRPEPPPAELADGPHVDGKEHLGGFTVIEVPRLDDVLDRARWLAGALRYPGVEVRPVLDRSERSCEIGGCARGAVEIGAVETGV